MGVRNLGVRSLKALALMLLTLSIMPSSASGQNRNGVGKIDKTLPYFTRNEQKRLLKGGDVRRHLKGESTRQKWLGGLAYQAIEGTPLELLASLKQEALLCKMIVYCTSARILSYEGGQARLRVKQSKGPIELEFTLFLRWNPAEKQAFFWLDTRERHDVKDMWGYFRLSQFTRGRSLVSFGVAIELPFAVRIFEKQVQSAALAMPKKWKAYNDQQKAIIKN